MSLTERKIYADIVRWEENVLKAKARTIKPEEQLESRFFESIDTMLFFIQALAQSPKWQQKAIEKICNEARMFDQSVRTLHDISQLPIEQIMALAEQQAKKELPRSLVHGSLTGTGGLLLLSLDFPLMIIQQMRTIQFIALSHGYTISHPTETLISLKVLHAALTPTYHRYFVWKATEREIEKLSHPYLYETDDSIVDRNWLESQWRHVLKVIVIRMLRKKTTTGLPLIRMVLGATVNYTSLKNVAIIAQKFYTKRLLQERLQNRKE